MQAFSDNYPAGVSNYDIDSVFGDAGYGEEVSIKFECNVIIPYAQNDKMMEEAVLDKVENWIQVARENGADSVREITIDYWSF